MDKLDPGLFFPSMDHFAHKGIFKGAERPWDVLSSINTYISELPSDISRSGLPAGLVRMDGIAMLYCREPVVLEKDLTYELLKIFIGAGTKIEPTAIIKGPVLIGRNCEIRQGAYLRGDVIAGTACTLGHATEIKNSILMDHSEAGHFNYIGDSVIVSRVNLGAGTKLANLKFRSSEAKKKGAFPEISFIHEKKRVKTGRSKFGAILGDDCELGCNSVTAPGTLLYPECMVMPNFTVPSGIHPKGSFLRPS